MITQFDIDATPLRAGEQRTVTATGEEPLKVEIKCFSRKPPPPGYKPCSQCGQFPIKSGHPRKFSADVFLFAEDEGFLEITVTDAVNDLKTCQIKVLSASAQIKDLARTINLAQERFGEAYEEAQKQLRRVERLKKMRVVAAYFLKGVAVFGGLAVGLGVKDVAARVIGIAVIVAITVDSYLSNHRSALAIVSANFAFKELLETVQHNHDVGLIQIERFQTSDPERFGNSLVDLLEQLRKQVYDGARALARALHDTDVAAISNLAVETRQSRIPDGTRAPLPIVNQTGGQAITT